MLSRTDANLTIPAFDDNPLGMTAKGTSAFFMHHPAIDRSQPEAVVKELILSVS